MEKQTIDTFLIIGITVRTSNQNGEGARDIPALWERFYLESVASNIPDKIGDEIYSIYTDYEGDYTKPYTTLIGCKVNSLNNIPSGMTGLTIKGGDFLKLTIKGDLTEGVVFEAWQKIWAAELQRTYIADFEVYGAKAQNPKDAEVDIYVGTK